MDPLISMEDMHHMQHEHQQNITTNSTDTTMDYHYRNITWLFYV